MGFRGLEIPIPLAEYGLTGTKNMARTPPTALIVARNIRLDGGAIAREGGSALYTPTAVSGDPAIRGLCDHWPTSLDQRLLAFTDAGTLLKDAGSGAFTTTLASGLNTDGLPVFAEGGAEATGSARKTFLTTGLNIVQVVSAEAAASTNIVRPPADWTGAAQPRFLVYHNNRLWGGLGHRLYASLATNHEDWLSTGVVQIPLDPGVGLYLQGAASFANRLWVWKWPRGLFWVDDSATDITNWRAHLLHPAHSLAGPNALDVVANDVCYMDANLHIHLLSLVQEFGDVKASDLTVANDMGDWVRENLSVTRPAAERVVGRYYAHRKQMHFACRKLGSLTNDIRVIVDFNGPNLPRIHVSDKDECEAFALRRDTNGIPRPVAGDSAGRVWSLDQTNTDIEGEGYASEWQTPHDDLRWFQTGLGARRKNWQWVELVTQPQGDFVLYLDVWLDGGLAQSLTISQALSGTALGSFVLGTSALGGDVLLNRRRRLRGSSRRISFAGRMIESGADFSVSQLTVGCTVGATKE